MANLSDHFSDEIIKTLDPGQRELLERYFSPYELDQLGRAGAPAVLRRVAIFEHEILAKRLSFIHREEYLELIDWYKQNCSEIDELYCGKCGNLLGIEVKHLKYDANEFFKMRRHPEGKFVVAIGPSLLASRYRMDGVMGYQCGALIDNPEYSKKNNKVPQKIRCFNDTRWSDPELAAVPEEHVLTQVTQEDMHNVQREIARRGYRPDVKKTAKGKRIESFELRKVLAAAA